MDSLWLVPALPLAGFLVLFVTQGKLPDRVVAFVGAGSVGLAALVALGVGWQFVQSGEASFALPLWTWIAVGDFTPSVTLYLDSLSLVMTGVITGVGFLIHLYATGYMWQDHEEPTGYSRFFAYMNLFVFAMLMLVLGDNLLTLFLGWEGVGLCSYLLIGFYHRDPGQRLRGAQGVRSHPCRRHADGPGTLPAVLGVQDARGPGDPGRRRLPDPGHGDCHRSAPAWRRGREVRPGTAPDLAAGRHGRPDPGVGAHPCRDDGHGRGLPDRAHAGRVLAVGGRAALRRRGRPRHAPDLVVHGADADRHQAASWPTRP